MSKHRVIFTADQRARVIAEAKRRQAYHEARGAAAGRNGQNNGPAERLLQNYVGCAGEMAVAIYTGTEDRVFEAKVPVRGLPDLPGKVEAKASPCHTHRMMAYLNDDFTKTFVFVTIQDKEIYLRGWLLGCEIEGSPWRADPTGRRPAYFVPVRELRAIETLPPISHL